MKRLLFFIALLFFCLSVFSQEPVQQKKQTKRSSVKSEHEMIDSTKVKKEKITTLKSYENEEKKATQKKEKSAVKESSKTEKRKIKSKLKEMN